MSSSVPQSRPPASSSSTTVPTSGSTEKQLSYFETQRAALVSEVAVSLELVLANINKLNRSLEGVIAVGNEFGSVEALWSQFENVMAKDPDAGDEGAEVQEGHTDNDEESEDGGPTRR